MYRTTAINYCCICSTIRACAEVQQQRQHVDQVSIIRKKKRCRFLPADHRTHAMVAGSRAPVHGHHQSTMPAVCMCIRAAKKLRYMLLCCCVMQDTKYFKFEYIGWRERPAYHTFRGCLLRPPLKNFEISDHVTTPYHHHPCHRKDALRSIHTPGQPAGLCHDKRRWARQSSWFFGRCVGTICGRINVCSAPLRTRGGSTWIGLQPRAQRCLLDCFCCVAAVRHSTSLNIREGCCCRR